MMKGEPAPPTQFFGKFFLGLSLDVLPLHKNSSSGTCQCCHRNKAPCVCFCNQPRKQFQPFCTQLSQLQVVTFHRLWCLYLSRPFSLANQNTDLKSFGTWSLLLQNRCNFCFLLIDSRSFSSHPNFLTSTLTVIENEFDIRSIFLQSFSIHPFIPESSQDSPGQLARCFAFKVYETQDRNRN